MDGAAYTQRLRESIGAVSGTEEGRFLLAHLCRASGFHRSSVVKDPRNGEVNPLATLHNEARRGFYLDLRAVIPEEVLRKTEHQKIKGDKKL